MDFIKALYSEMPMPPVYGWFHIIFLIFAIVLTIGCVFLVKYKKNKGFKYGLLALWIIMIILEAFKQVIYSFTNIGGGEFIFRYNYTALPWQICSMPLYFLPLVIFLKDSKFKDAIAIFLATFGLLAGSIVLLYPAPVLQVITNLNIQSLLHHGIQLATGVMVLYYYKDKINIKNYLWGIVILACIFLVAISINELVYSAFGEENLTNLCTINRHVLSNVPIIEQLQKAIPYPVFVILYLFAYSLITSLFTLFAYFLIKKMPKLKEKRSKQTN